MKMNIDCIRETLSYIIDTQVMNSDLQFTPLVCESILTAAALSGYSREDIYYSLILLEEEKYIVCSIQSFGQSKIIYEIQRVTYNGQKFYESVRDKTIWERTKDTAKRVGNHTLGFLEQIAHDVAVEAAKQAVLVSTGSHNQS